MSYPDVSTNFGVERKSTEESVVNYDVIRRYDQGMLEFLVMWSPKKGADGVFKEQAVPITFASPRRVFQDDEDRLTNSTWVGDFDPTQVEQLVYPSLALTRMDATFDAARWNYAEWRKLSYSSDLNMVSVAGAPLPYTFIYQVDFWTKTYHDLNLLQEQYIRKFPRPTWWIDVQLPPPWGTQSIHIQHQNMFSNASILEVGEQQRDLRGVATINLFGWIPLPLRWVRTVQKLSYSIIEESSQEILETYETEYASKQEYWDTGEKEQVLEWK